MLNELATVEADPRDRLGEVLGEALDESRPGATVVLVTTRPSRLDDPARFDDWWRTPSRQAWLPRVTVVDVSQPDLSELFVIE